MLTRSFYAPFAIAAGVAWLAGIVAVTIGSKFGGQPSELATTAAFLQTLYAGHAPGVLQFLGGDTLFVWGYMTLFSGVAGTAYSRAPVLASVAAGGIVLMGSFDMLENAIYIAGAGGALKGQTPVTPAGLLNTMSFLKWNVGALTVGLLGAIYPGRGFTGIVLKGLMISLPVLLTIGMFVPVLMPIRGLFFMISMPFFVVHFARLQMTGGAANAT